MTYSTFNLEAKDCYNVVDQWGMVDINNDDDQTPMDAAWRTAAGYKAWKYYHLYSAPMYKCMRKRPEEGANSHLYHWQYRRHPKYNWGSDDMSRDHVISLFLLAYFGVQDGLANSLAKLRNMIDNTKWKISDDTNFTIDMWFWMKGILSKRYRTLWYIIQIPILAVGSMWNKWQLKRGDFTMPELTQHGFVKTRINYNVTEKQDKIRHNMYPYYALEGLAWQNYINPDSPGKRMLSKRIIRLCGANNYLLRLLADDMTVIKGQVLMYLDMTGNRWGVLLNEACRRTVRFLSKKEAEFNRLESDLLIAIWNEKHPEDQINERI